MPLYRPRHVVPLPRLGHRDLGFFYPYDDYVAAVEGLEDEPLEEELVEEELEDTEPLPARFVTAGRMADEPREPFLRRPPRWRPTFRLRRNPTDPDAAHAVLHDLLLDIGEPSVYHALKNHPEHRATILALAGEAHELPTVVIYEPASRPFTRSYVNIWVLVTDGMSFRNIRSHHIYERHLVAEDVLDLGPMYREVHERARALARQLRVEFGSL